MRFDWYQASIPEVDPEVVMRALAASNSYGDWEQSRPLKNYDSGAAFMVGNETFFKINFGGQNAEHGPNVIGSGPAAQQLADVIRSRFPSHRVSRLDSCEDYHSPKAYDYLRTVALKIAKDQRVQCREIVKPLADSDDGRTLYLGSQTSAVSMRIYEKGKQLGCGTEWVRAELQVRPQKDAKAAMAFLDPTEVWGLAKWSHAMGVKLTGNKNLQRVDAQIYQPSDHERAYRFMLKQYRKVLEQMNASHGSPEAVGAQIFYDLAHPDDLEPVATLRPV